MGKSKKKVSTPSPTKEVKKYPVVTSSDCEKCQTQCSNGIKYLQRMSVPGTRGNGVVCKK